MKILFVYTGPANPYDHEFNVNESFLRKIISEKLVFPKPLTFPIIAALTPSAHDIDLVEGGVNKIDFSKDYDIVGISCTTRYANWAYDIADEFRSRDVLVALGGWHPSALPNEAKPHADTVFVGEAEDTWPEFLKDFQKERLKDFYIPKKPADPSVVKNPRYEIYPKNTEFGVLASRGCPYHCKFCAISNMKLRNIFRKRHVEDVLEEIKNLPIKNFSFQDNSMTIDVDYTKKIFKGMKDLNKNFISNGNIRTLGEDDELLRLAAEAGCVSWFVGFESVSQESLDYVGKKANKVKEYISAVKKIHDYGMAVAGSFVLGFDYDRPDIFEKTKEFADISEIDMPDAGVLTPFPGTPVFDQFEKENRLISKNWDDYDYIKVVYQPKNMTPEELFENTIDLNKY